MPFYAKRDSFCQHRQVQVVFLFLCISIGSLMLGAVREDAASKKCLFPPFQLLHRPLHRFSSILSDRCFPVNNYWITRTSYETARLEWPVGIFRGQFPLIRFPAGTPSRMPSPKPRQQRSWLPLSIIAQLAFSARSFHRRLLLPMHRSRSEIHSFSCPSLRSQVFRAEQEKGDPSATVMP